MNAMVDVVTGTPAVVAPKGLTTSVEQRTRAAGWVATVWQDGVLLQVAFGKRPNEARTRALTAAAAEQPTAQQEQS